MPLSDSTLGPGRATLVNALGIVVPGLITLLTVPLFIHAIGNARYGVLTIIWLLIGYFGVFDLGFGRALTHRLGELRLSSLNLQQQSFWTAAGLSLVTGLLGGLLFFSAASFWLHTTTTLTPSLKQEAIDTLPWVLLALPLATTLSVLSGTLMGYGAFLSLNLGQIIGNLLFQLLPLGIALWFSHSLAALIPAALLGRTSSLLVMAMSCRKILQLRGPPRFSRSEVRPLLHYGGWIMVTALADPLLTVVDRFVIGFLHGASAVTAYTVPFSLVNTTLMIFPASLQRTITPVLSQGDAATIQQKSHACIHGILALMTPFVVLATLLITPFLDRWIGPSLTLTAGKVGILLLVGNGINALAQIPFTVLQCQGRPDVPARFHVWELVPYGILLWGLTDRFGVHGAAIAWDVRVLIDTLLLFHAAGMAWMLRRGIQCAVILGATAVLALTLSYHHAAYPWLGIALLLSSLPVSWTLLPKDWRYNIFHPRG